MSDLPQNEGGSGGGLSTDLLAADGVAEAKRTQEDVAMVSRAVRERWGVKKKDAVVDRMLGVVEKKSIKVLTTDGTFEDEARADGNAIAAARVLVSMDEKDQTDHWNEDKNTRLDEGKMTERVGMEPVILRQPVKPE